MIEIVSIFVAASDGQDARQQDLGQRMLNPARIAPIEDHRGSLSAICIRRAA